MSQLFGTQRCVRPVGAGEGGRELLTVVRQSQDPHPQPLPTRGRGAYRVSCTVVRLPLQFAGELIEL
jgi:hypothetical protein